LVRNRFFLLNGKENFASVFRPQGFGRAGLLKFSARRKEGFEGRNSAAPFGFLAARMGTKFCA
jgi:hypothetical protein